MNIQINQPLMPATALRSPHLISSTPAAASNPDQPGVATDAFEAHGLAAELDTPTPSPGVWSSLALGGMIALSLGGALAAHPASAATMISSSSQGGVYVSVDRTGGMATTAKPAAPAGQATPAAPAGQATQQAQPAAPAAPAASTTKKSSQEHTVADTKTYILDMLEANDIQTGAQITYQNALASNIQTMDRIGWAIRNTPDAQSDPQLKRVAQKLQAASDTLGVDFTYETWNDVLSSKDGWSKKNYEVHRDYSGQAQMTDNTIASIQRIMHYQKVVR